MYCAYEGNFRELVKLSSLSSVQAMAAAGVLFCVSVNFLHDLSV